MGGDVLGILGTSYDVTFRLPNVPPGTYELRLGYCALVDRGIGQVYVDGIPQGIPMDMRYSAGDSRVGGLTMEEKVGETKKKTPAVFTPQKNWKKMPV